MGAKETQKRAQSSTPVSEMSRRRTRHRSQYPPGGTRKTNTAQRVLRRFDVAKFCRTCKACQLDSARSASKAPLNPLLIIGEPFRRIAMGIVGLLPKNASAKRFILMVCDYATRYPEAVALSSTDAAHVAEELVCIFSRVEIPEEILHWD